MIEGTGTNVSGEGASLLCVEDVLLFVYTAVLPPMETMKVLLHKHTNTPHILLKAYNMMA